MKRSILRSNRTLLACFAFAVIATITGLILLQPKHSASALIAADPSTIPACAGSSECFAFTVDTRLNLDGATTGTATAFSIPTSSYLGGASNHGFHWIVNWGDGTEEQTFSGTSSTSSAGIPHTYPTAGKYQITIRPNTDTPAAGWMNAFGFYSSTAGSNITTNKYMFYSIDTPFTDMMRTKGSTNRFAYMFYDTRNTIGIPENLFTDVSTTGDTNFSYMFRSTFHLCAYNSTAATIPARLFDSIDTSTGTNFSYMFQSTFEYYAFKSTTGDIPARLFSSVDTSNGTSFLSMFYNTFSGYSYSSTKGTIPEDLFASIDIAKSATNFTSMFYQTFNNYAHDSTVGVIPAGLFASLDTTKATNFSNMFYNTFSYFAYASATATIPDGLFDLLNTSNGTNFTAMFYGTFSYHAHASAKGTIPAELFANLNTAKGTNFSKMFSNTFYYYTINSTATTIPASLFASLDTTKGTNFSEMFNSTFYHFAYASTIATIPAGLFDSIDTSLGINFSSMFKNAFFSYAYSSKTATIPAGLFDSIDTSLGTGSNFGSMFSGTFSSYAYKSTEGTIPAGLFDSIDTSLGTNFTSMFYNTFLNYANSSTKATIPAGLFAKLNTAKGTVFSSMFNSTFASYATASSAGTIPDDLFASIDTSAAATLTNMYNSVFSRYAQRTATFKIGDTIVKTQTFTWPYATRNITIDESSTHNPTVNKGDTIVPSYHAILRRINKPTEANVASIPWHRTDGTSCEVAAPTPDCGAQEASTLVAFPDTDEWLTKVTSTEKGNVTFYGKITPSIDLETSANVTSVSAAFQNIIYKFSITNSGNVPITGLAIDYSGVWADDTNPGFSGNTDSISEMTCSITPGLGLEDFSLAPNTTVDCFVTYKAEQNDIDRLGGIDLRAVASGNAMFTDEAVTTNASGVHVAASATPTLSINKIATRADGSKAIDESLVVGEIINYHFVVTNDGFATVRNILIDDETGDFTGTGTISAITCPETELVPFEIMTCTANYTVTSEDPAIIKNEAHAEGVGTSGTTEIPVTSASSSATIPYSGAPALTLTKSHEPLHANGSWVKDNDKITYIFRIANTGNVPITGVSIDDMMVDAEHVASCSGWTMGGTLTPGQIVECEANYPLTQADIDATHVDNTAKAIGTYGAAAVVSADDADIAYPVTAPDITLRLTSTPTEVRFAGDTISYGYTLINDGNVTLTGVSVEDTGPTGGTGDMSAVSCEWSGAVGVISPQDASVKCSAIYHVTKDDIENGLSLENMASAVGHGPAGKRASSKATVVTAIHTPPAPDNPDDGDDSTNTPGSGVWTVDAEGQSVEGDMAIILAGCITVGLLSLCAKRVRRRKGERA